MNSHTYFFLLFLHIINILEIKKKGEIFMAIILDCDLLPDKKRSLVDEYDDLELEQPMSFNQFRPSETKKDKKASEISEADDDQEDDWAVVLQQFKTPKVKTTKSYKNSDVFELLHGEGKKKKKKKKEKEGPKDYYDDFAPDINLLQNMAKESISFAEDLQKRYYTLSASKSSARGVGKFTTDLISSINQARDVSVKLVNTIASLKKNVIDLNMKERKENAAIKGEDGEDMAAYSASFLKKLIQQDRSDAAMYGDSTPTYADEDDLFANISDALGETNRPDEVDTYLKYENRDIQKVAFVNRDTNDYVIKAIAGDTGEEIPDYPLPEIAHLEINPSTEIATDEYHSKYPIIWT